MLKNKIRNILKRILYEIMDFHPFLYRPQYKLFKHKVEIHKTDKDIWPSYPHLHVLDDSIKIDIYTGKLYRIQTKQEINELSNEEMVKLWNDKKFLEIVLEARKNKPINVRKLEEIPYQWIDCKTKEWMKKHESNSV